MCLDVHEMDMRRQSMREPEDYNTHRLLQQHLYKARKQVHAAEDCLLQPAILIPGPGGAAGAAVFLSFLNHMQEAR